LNLTEEDVTGDGEEYIRRSFAISILYSVLLGSSNQGR